MGPLPALLFALLPFPLAHSHPNPQPRSPQCAAYPPKSPTHPTLTTCLPPSLPPNSNPLTYHPWTHPPHCIPSPSSPNPNSPPFYCVYTNAHHNLSIITTPDEASTTLNPLRHPLTAPFFAPDKLMLPRPYEVRDVPGKGKGAVATRRIGKGMAVLVEGVRVLAGVEYPADVGRVEVRVLLGEAVGRLGAPGEVLGLVRGGGRKGGNGEEEEEGEGDGVGGVMEDVMVTNSFGVVVGGKEYMGLFVDAAVSLPLCFP